MDNEYENKPNLIVRILKFLWGMLRAYLLTIGVIATLIPLSIIYFVSRDGDLKSIQSREKLELTHDAVLHVRISGDIKESNPTFEEQVLQRFFGGERGVYLPEVRTALRRAAKDKHVLAAFVEIDQAFGSSSEFSELRREFKKFKDSGKKLYVWLSAAETYLYYFASVADQVYLAPVGDLTVTGPYFQLVYVSALLKKIGVDIDVIRAGKYKSAFEFLIADKPSAETLEVYQSMEKNLRSKLIEEVALSRNKAPDVVKGWFEQSIFSAKTALESGLVDVVGFAEEQKDELRKILEGKDGKKDKDKKGKLKFLSLEKYLDHSEKIDDGAASTGTEGIAFIQAEGEIMMFADGSAREKVITPETLRKELKWALDEDDVKAVVMRVNSPGGSALASDLIWNDVRKLGQKKPVVVSMGEVAASGGYYISASAKKIFAEPTTITGSIGVIGAVPNVSAFKEKYGVSFYVVTQSARSKLLNPGEKASDFDKAIMESGIAEVYNMFLRRVSEGRRLQMEKVDALAQGRVYTGTQAQELGLVDEMGGLAEAYASAKELAGLDPKKLYPVHQYKGEELQLSECLKNLSNMMECLHDLETETRLPISLDDQLLRRVKAIKSILAKEKYLALWPNFLR